MESEVENKGMSGRTESAGVPTALSAGFSPGSEVHIVPFPAFPCLWSSSLHSCLYFTFALWPWDPFKMPPPPSTTHPPPSSLPLWFVRREWISLFLSRSLSTPSTLSHSLSLPPHLWLDILIPPFNGRHLSSDSCLELRPSCLAARFPTILYPIIKYSCNINSHECALLGVREGRRRSGSFLLIWAQARGRQQCDRRRESEEEERVCREKLFDPKKPRAPPNTSVLRP